MERRNNLGIIAIPSPDPWSMAFNVGSMALTFIPSMFGRGRREADQIVPHQRELYTRIQQIEAALLRGDVTVDQFRAMHNALWENWEWMQDFIFSGQFTDRRASEQGYGDMRVYVEGLTADGRAVTRHPNPDTGGQLGAIIPPGGALGSLEKRIGLMLGAPFDWNRLVDFGFETAERFLPDPGFQQIPTAGGGTLYRDPATGVYYDPTAGGQITVTAEDPGELPDWVVPVAVGAGVLVIGSMVFRR